jgi:3'-phosphoadenosine 5'-phosphosulfate sulfotransferase (PAPS reductase)/FAD synthetase
MTSTQNASPAFGAAQCSTAHIVALSGGKDSTAMALRLAESEPRDYSYVVTPTGQELPEMQEHWKRLSCLLGRKLVKLQGPTMEELVMKWNALPNWRMRWCTKEIKIKPFMSYVSAMVPAVVYIGLRADEVGEDAREGTNWKGVEGVTQDSPLVRWGWGISRVIQYLSDCGVAIPERTDCDMCFFQRVSEWWRLWHLHRERFEKAAEWETITGHTLRTEKPGPWPTSLRELGKRFEAGYVPKGADQLNMRFDIAERKTMCAWCAR